MKEKELIDTILLLEKEQLRRNAKNKLKSYNTGEKIHHKQIAFHKCSKRNRWVFGGNRSGKTECGAVEAIWLARGCHPYKKNKDNVKGWIVSLSYEVQRDVAQEKILRYLNPEWIHEIVMHEGKKSSPEYGIIDHIVIKNTFGGLSQLGFKSCDQGREKFQGTSLDFVWFDEEPPEDIYIECRMRVLDRKGEIFGTMTPLKGLTWVYDEIYLNKSQNPEVWHEHIEWADNPFLDGEEIEKLSKSIGSQLDSRRFGRFNVAFGQVYGEFDQSVHIINPFPVPKEWQDNISIDPGLNNPLACLFFAVDYDGIIYVVAEHYEAGRDIDYHSDAIKQLAKKLDWNTDYKGRLTALIDSAATQHTLAYSKSVAELFFEKGIAVNPNVNKSLFTGIARIKELLAAKPPKLYIFSCCKNLIAELKTYWWGKGDTPIKKDDHCLDALRYFVMSRPNAKEPAKPAPSIIEIDKKRLSREVKNIDRVKKLY